MVFDVRIEEHLAEVLVPRLERIAREAIAARGRFAIALPGGSVATTCFPRFAEANVDWSRTHFFWCDERAVSATHPESNYGVAEKLWLERITMGHSPTIHRMEADHADLGDAARRYERALREKGPLDLALLGMGPDGHVCSLFPGHAMLAEKERLVGVIEDSPKPPPKRLTLTLPALAAAGEVVIVATGAAKADIVRAVCRDEASQLPAALALRGAKKGTIVLDAAAASKLS